MKMRHLLSTAAFLFFIISTTYAVDSDTAAEKHQKISQTFVQILHEQWGVDKSRIKSDTLFLNDFGADSTDIIELVMAVEDYFDVEIGDEEWSRVTTVDSAVDLIIDKTTQPTRFLW